MGRRRGVNVSRGSRINRALRLLGSSLSGGVLLQSSCPLAEDFDPFTLFAQVASTLIGDSIFFALDSYLVAVG